ncbi:MAG: FkbM family methyltransferase [Cyanobacteriota bacterium]
MKKYIKNLIPVKLYETFFINKSFSHEGEDLIINKIFSQYSSNYKGFYIDIGAYHPMRYSNTYLLYKLGWNGINIDANPDSMKLFKKYRSRDINLECAISSKKETKTYYMFNDPALNGFSKQLSQQRNCFLDYKIINQLEVETFPLYEILNKYLQPSQQIDLFNIDVEGLDFEVLKSNDWNKFKPKVIVIEILECDFLKVIHTDIYKFLIDLGYYPYSKTFSTMIFSLKE